MDHCSNSTMDKTNEKNNNNNNNKNKQTGDPGEGD